MRIDVLTLYPEVIDTFASVSVIGKGQQSNLLDVRTHNIRDAATDVHRTVDDSPFGGGAGMVMKPEPIFDTIEQVQPPRPIIYLTPAGRPFDQEWAMRLSQGQGFTMLCGRFEGVDERVRTELIDEELSVGDFVLAGGEVAAAAVIEAVGRLVPGVLGNDTSVVDESFGDGLLEYPHYTRPADFRGLQVPKVLLSGDHERVRRWRKAQSLAKTRSVRLDMIAARGGLSDEDRELLAEFGLE